MEIKIGLWEKKSQKGNTYYAGKFKQGEKEYKISLFKNENKLNEKSPDFQFFVRDSIITLEKQENENEGQKNIELEQNKNDVSQTYADFGNMSEDDFPEEPF